MAKKLAKTLRNVKGGVIGQSKPQKVGQPAKQPRVQKHAL